MSWRTCKKFDAHVHVLPGERAAQFCADAGPDARWSRCGAEDFLRRMDRYGIEQVRRILRAFGPERLIFGTGFPGGEYDAYFDILDQMDFTDGESEQIAWRNIAGLLAPEDRR